MIAINHPGKPELVCYNFLIHRYPAHLRSLAKSDCETGMMLLEAYKASPTDENFEAVEFYHNWLSQTYFGTKHAGDKIEMPGDDFREFDAQRKRIAVDPSHFASELSEDVDLLQIATTANDRIAEVISHRQTIIKQKRQASIAKARQSNPNNNKLIQSINKRNKK